MGAVERDIDEYAESWGRYEAYEELLERKTEEALEDMDADEVADTLCDLPDAENTLFWGAIKELLTGNQEEAVTRIKYIAGERLQAQAAENARDKIEAERREAEYDDY